MALGGFFTRLKDGLARSTQNGLLTGTTLATITDAFTYNQFGEVTGYTAAGSAGTSFFSIDLTRDDAGRPAVSPATPERHHDMSWPAVQVPLPDLRRFDQLLSIGELVHA